ncbi:MAG TPA: hypothetical protein VGD36_14290, partial [Xanthobacteraceae bacterium]
MATFLQPKFREAARRAGAAGHRRDRLEIFSEIVTKSWQHKCGTVNESRHAPALSGHDGAMKLPGGLGTLSLATKPYA